MFNMAESANRIRNARIAKNLTQMNIADALGVSYQAVSNWERGNSMPDIGKLGELSDLLGVSIEDLLGHTRDSKNIERLMKKDKLEDIAMSLSELSDISPVLPPDITEQLAGELKAKKYRGIGNDSPFCKKGAAGTGSRRFKSKEYRGIGSDSPFCKRETPGADGGRSESKKYRRYGNDCTICQQRIFGTDMGRTEGKRHRRTIYDCALCKQGIFGQAFLKAVPFMENCTKMQTV